MRPIGLRDVPIEFDRLRSRSAYQTQSSRPPSGFAPLGRLARKIALKCNFRPQPTAAHLAVRSVFVTMAKSISIDNNKLHEIRMYIPKINGRYPAYVLYPKDRIEFQKDGDNLILLIPSLLCVEIFRSGILPSERESPRAVSIKISGKKIGNFVLEGVQYPDRSFNERVKLKFERQ